MRFTVRLAVDHLATIETCGAPAEHPAAPPTSTRPCACTSTKARVDQARGGCGAPDEPLGFYDEVWAVDVRVRDLAGTANESAHRRLHGGRRRG